MNIVLRIATQEDYEAVCALFAQVDHIHAQALPRRFVHIEDLVVSEHFRHQGVGQTLIERVYHWAREKGLTEVELDVWEFNTSAQALYEKLGYQITRRHMRKQLL